MDGLAKDMDAKKWMGEIGEACIVGTNSLPARERCLRMILCDMHVWNDAPS